MLLFGLWHAVYNLAQVHLTIPIVCEAAQAVIVKLYTVLRIARSMIPSYGSLKFPFLQSKALSSLALKNSRAIVYALYICTITLRYIAWQLYTYLL